MPVLQITLFLSLTIALTPAERYFKTIIMENFKLLNCMINKERRGKINS